MALLNPVLVFLIVLCAVSHQCHSEHCSDTTDYIVSDRGNDTECYGIQRPSHHCKTLQFLLKQVTHCANIKLNDDQTFTESIFKGNVSDLIISGNFKKLKCNEESGIFFESSVRILITNLVFVNCSMNASNFAGSENQRTLDFLFSSVTFHGGEAIEIVGCSFSDSIGSSLLLIDVNGSVIEGSTFTGSQSAAPKTGGIVIRRVKMRGDFRYTVRNCNFTGIHAIPEGVIECPLTNLEPYDSIKDAYAGHGAAVDIRLDTQDSITNMEITGSHFTDNKAVHGGAVSMAFGGRDSESTLALANSTFNSNFGCIQGGAVLVFSDAFLESHTTNSSASLNIESTTFNENTAFWGGGISMYRCHSCGNLSFTASDSTWRSNIAFTSGYAVAIGGNRTSMNPEDPYKTTHYHARASFTNCEFLRNTNERLYQNINAIGAVYMTAGELDFYGDTLFDSNYGTALLLHRSSRASFTGDILFNENFGISGGAVYLLEGSHIKVNPPADLHFLNNRAIVSGGAVYSKTVQEIYGFSSVPCPFQLDEDDLASINVTFEGNMVSNSDQAIFVGNPDLCDHILLLSNFTYMPDIKNQIQTVAENISFHTSPQMTNGTLRVMLGEPFYLDPVVTDKFGHNSMSFGYLTLLVDETFEYAETLNFTLVGPTSMGVNNFTKNNAFYITGPDDYNISELVVEFWYNLLSSYRSGNAIVPLELVPCKIGAKYSPDTQKCECASDENIICQKNSTKVCIKKGYWYDPVTKKTIPCPTTNCNYSNGNCPKRTEPCPSSPGYCILESADDVCWTGRGGYLCSKCKDGYGFSFSAIGCSDSSTCRPRNTVLIMLGVLAYWFLFIAVLLFILTFNNISVGSGFMYGLIYYFSVVTLFTDESMDNIFLRYLISACVSVTQFDPRIVFQFQPICFVKQMDNALHHLALRYLTPLFIICVILVIIWISRSRFCYLPKRISLSENSPIHAICILILYSYTYLSHTNFLILRPMVIDGQVRVAASPTTRYFDPKGHLPYALFALCMELFVSLPICFLFLFAPCLARRVNLVKYKLLPILDEFQACYRPESRWFAGFYFLARQLMYFASIIPQSDLPQTNMLLAVLSVTILLIHCSFQPYKKWWLNFLDTVLLTDILLFSAYTMLTADPPQLSGLNWFTFEAAPFVLLLFPACCLVGVLSTLLFKRLWMWFCSIRKRFRRHHDRNNSHREYPTTTVVTVDRERSLSTSQSARSSPFTDSFFKDVSEREPLLADLKSGEYGNSGGIDRDIFDSEGLTHSSIELIPTPKASCKV